MPTIEELDRMDDLSGAILYSAELHHLPPFTPEEEASHVTQARAGNEESRAVLVARCLPWLMAKAVAIYVEDRPTHSDIMDLVGQANLEMVESLPNALQATNPIKYLMSVGALAMKRYCYYGDPIIRRPRFHGGKNDIPTTVSLEGGDWPLIESLATPDVYLTGKEDDEWKMRVQDQIVYDALQQLSPRYRNMLTDYYGLYGQPAKRSGDIAAELGMNKKAVEHVIARAKAKMASVLGSYVLQQRVNDR